VDRNETIEVQPIRMLKHEITGDVKQRAGKWLEAISYMRRREIERIAAGCVEPGI
jgi:hypothetical protein